MTPSSSPPAEQEGKKRKHLPMTPYRRGRFDAAHGNFNPPYVGCPRALKSWRRGVRDIIAGRSERSRRANILLGGFNYQP